MNPAVITSKAAQKDFLNIQAKHLDIVQGLTNQSVRVAAVAQQKQAELAAQNAMNAEMEKERIAANTESQKTALDFAQRQGELDVKRAALSLK